MEENRRTMEEFRRTLESVVTELKKVNDRLDNHLNPVYIGELKNIIVEKVGQILQERKEIEGNETFSWEQFLRDFSPLYEYMNIELANNLNEIAKYYRFQRNPRVHPRNDPNYEEELEKIINKLGNNDIGQVAQYLNDNKHRIEEIIRNYYVQNTQENEEI